MSVVMPEIRRGHCLNAKSSPCLRFPRALPAGVTELDF